VVDQLYLCARKGLTLEAAAELIGVHDQSIRDWFALSQVGVWHNGYAASETMLELASAAFAVWKRGQAEFEAECTERIHNWRNFKGDDDWRQYAWHLEHSPSTRSRWGAHVTVQQTTDTTVTIRSQLAPLPTDQLRALLDAALAALPSANLPATEPDQPPTDTDRI
jgi:hypothetical protein